MMTMLVRCAIVCCQVSGNQVATQSRAAANKRMPQTAKSRLPTKRSTPCCTTCVHRPRRRSLSWGAGSLRALTALIALKKTSEASVVQARRMFVGAGPRSAPTWCSTGFSLFPSLWRWMRPEPRPEPGRRRRVPHRQHRLSAATARCAPPSAVVNVVTFGPTVLVTRLAANAALAFRWILYPVPLATFVQVSRTCGPA